MHKRHGKSRRERRSQKKIILLTTITLIFIMSVGYAAFSTNINITARGTISEKVYTTTELKSKYCGKTSADGLYVDTYESCDSSTYENCRCIYKGSNPNNYISLQTITGTEMYRIVSIEADGKLKLISDEKVAELPWDSNNKNNWETASLNTYLNTTYYNNFSASTKSKINKGNFNIGKISYFGTLLNSLSEEKTKNHENYIALINISEYMRASTNINCTGNTVHSFDNEHSTIEYYPCSLDNYLYKSDYVWYLLNAYTYCDYHIAWINPGGFINSPGDGSKIVSGIRPVLYLQGDITLKNKGTKQKPYEIIE